MEWGDYGRARRAAGAGVVGEGGDGAVSGGGGPVGATLFPRLE